MLIPRTAPKMFKNNQKNYQKKYQKSAKTIKKQSKINQNNQKSTPGAGRAGGGCGAETPIFEFLGRFLIVLIDFDCFLIVSADF